MEEYGLFANVVSDSALRIGAKVQILIKHGDGYRLKVRGLNQQGREIEKYVNHRRLTKFRPGWLNAGQRALTSMYLGTKDAMTFLANNWNIAGDPPANQPVTGGRG